MKVYTYSEARQRLADLLNEAQQEGGDRSDAKMDASLFCSLPR